MGGLERPVKRRKALKAAGKGDLGNRPLRRLFQQAAAFARRAAR